MLKKLRIITALLVFCLVLACFIGPPEFAERCASVVLSFQFIPSLFKYVFGGAALLSFGFLLIVVLTLVFGRIYCASFCPLGILQDIVIFVSKKLNLKRSIGFQRPWLFLRYFILFLTLVSVMLGTLVLANLLDPFSMFGRIASELILPNVSLLNNQVVNGMEYLGIYAVWPMTVHTSSFLVLMIITAFFLLIVLFSAFSGRLYCNTICPVGTLLGLFSRFSLFRIGNAEELCNGCGVCEKACPAQCINSENKGIDLSRCTMCFDCLEVCPGKALSYKPLAASSSQPLEASRRKFLTGSAWAGLGFTLGAFPFGSILKNKFSLQEKTAVSPPGSRELEAFSSACTACHLCVAVCPTKVIQPSLYEYGLRGLLQPTLKYEQGYCEYECRSCTQVCPSGAILSLSLEQKKRTQIGRVRFLREECVVEKKKKDCGACAEVCPTHAVHMIEEKGLFFPKTDADVCIGCGHCELACPTAPKAIVVDGNLVHKIANEPFSNAAPGKAVKDVTEEFPF